MKINYIRHLTGVYQRFAEDDRLNPTHISLYMALFQYWNLNRFKERFYIIREEVMELAKVGSRATYQKCINELHVWGYVRYYPSRNPFKGSTISMTIFCSTDEQVVSQAKDKAVVPYINNTKDETNIKQEQRNIPLDVEEVLSVIVDKSEAEKFYNYYASNGWRIGGKTPMKDWRAAARNWLLKSKEFKKGAGEGRSNYLQTKQDKDYGEPL